MEHGKAFYNILLNFSQFYVILRRHFTKFYVVLRRHYTISIRFHEYFITISWLHGLFHYYFMAIPWA